MFVAAIALVWAALLVPSAIRNRLEPSPINGVRSFERSMGILASSTRSRRASSPGRWIMVPRHDVTANAPASSARRRSRIIRRRRQYFERLLIAAGATLVLGFVPHLHWIWFVHLAVDAGLGFYITRLLGYKRAETESRALPVAEEPAANEPIQHASSL